MLRYLLVLAALSLPLAAQVQVFPNNDDSVTPWTECYLPACQPGGANPPTQVITAEGSNPSLDGSAIKFSLQGLANTNVLWIDKFGANTNVTRFVHSFSLYYTGSPGNVEMDLFDFAAPLEYMFGTQCNLTKQLWQVWDQLVPSWINTTIPCTLAPNGWHAITIYDHLSGVNMIFDAISVDGQLNELNITEPAGTLPVGWSNTVGEQFQLDIVTCASTCAATLYVDEDEFTELP